MYGYSYSRARETTPKWAYVLLGVLLLVFTGIQGVYSGRMHLWGGQPDFLLTLSIIAGVFSTPTAGTITGFCAGLLHHASGTPYFGTYLFSRTLACFVASSVLVNRMQQNFLAALVGVFVGSVVADVVFIVSAPNFGAGAWLRMTLVGAVMNTLLAIPLALLLRLCGFRENRL